MGDDFAVAMLTGQVLALVVFILMGEWFLAGCALLAMYIVVKSQAH